MSDSRLQDLIGRLEKAEGPDRELDALIWDRLGLVNETHCRDWCRMDGRTDLTRDRYIAAWAPNYTKSLDDAMKLVPATAQGVCVEDGTTQREEWQARVIDWDGDDHDSPWKKNPALALTIASLKALASSRTQEQET